RVSDNALDLPSRLGMPDRILHREVKMNRKSSHYLCLWVCRGIDCARAECRAAQVDARVTKSMESLKGMTAKLGTPKLEGKEAVGGKEAPALSFGTTKSNNNFGFVDAVRAEDGQGMTATLFAKGEDEYIRVSTSVPKPDGSGRAVGTVLAGPELES